MLAGKQGYTPRDEATYNALIPGMPELSGIRQRLNSCVEEVNAELLHQPVTTIPLAVAIPLYIYPAEGCWDELYKVLERYESVEFQIIINPANGPGGRIPDANYIKEVTRLNTYKNCTLFGYVHVNWGDRKLDLVTRDITTWSHWRDCRRGGDIGVAGIFVDEAPSELSKLEYMRAVYQHAKVELGDDALIWTNPGVQIDQAFYMVADLVNSHENTHEGWRQGLSFANDKSTAMIHSYTGSIQQLLDDVEILRKAHYRSILITTGNAYTSFSTFLDNFVNAVAKAGTTTWE